MQEYRMYRFFEMKDERAYGEKKKELEENFYLDYLSYSIARGGRVYGSIGVRYWVLGWLDQGNKFDCMYYVFYTRGGGLRARP